MIALDLIKNGHIKEVELSDDDFKRYRENGHLHLRGVVGHTHIYQGDEVEVIATPINIR